MNDITHLFDKLIHQYKSLDIAESEFRKLLIEDEYLREEYKEWCHSVGSSEKNGFWDYCDEYMNSQGSIWDSLNDYDN